MACKPAHKGVPLDPEGPFDRLGQLSFCQEMARHTCCARAATDALLRRSQTLAAVGMSEPCRRASDAVACGSCRADVGVGNVTALCPDLCDAWLAACRLDFWSAPADGGALQPCVPGQSLLCARAADIAPEGGEAFCRAMGHRVAAAEPADDAWFGLAAAPVVCYDGRPLRSVGPPAPREGAALSPVAVLGAVLALLFGLRVLSRLRG